MEHPSRTYRFDWRGIDVEVTYTPIKWGAIVHLEIRSVAPKHTPLPITESGYLSHFHPIGTVEARGGDVVAQVLAWVEEAATSREWLAHVERSRQMTLF